MGNQRHFWNWEAVIRSNHIQLTIQQPAASSLSCNSANKERLYIELISSTKKQKDTFSVSSNGFKLQGPWQPSPRANLRGGDCSVIGHETNRSENLFESICRSWLKMWSRNRFRSGSKVVRSLFRIMVGKKFFGSWWEKSCKGIPCSLLNQSETETLPDYQLQKSVENISKFKSSDHVEILFVCLRTKSRNSDYKQ